VSRSKNSAGVLNKSRKTKARVGAYAAARASSFQKALVMKAKKLGPSASELLKELGLTKTKAGGTKGALGMYTVRDALGKEVFYGRNHEIFMWAVEETKLFRLGKR
jgi:hypothetical protein